MGRGSVIRSDDVGAVVVAVLWVQERAENWRLEIGDWRWEDDDARSFITLTFSIGPLT